MEKIQVNTHINKDNLSGKRSVLESISRVLDTNSFIFKKHPQIVFQELYNRLKRKAEKDLLLHEKFDFERSRYKKPWLRCLYGQFEKPALLRSFTGHRSWVTDCAFSPNGKHILSASYDGTLKIWNTATGEELLTIESPAEEVIRCEYSPDGKRIVSASTKEYGKEYKLTLWDASIGRKIADLQGYWRGGSNSVFSLKGNYLAAPSDGTTFKIWEADTGHELQTFIGHDSEVISCAFSPDGERVVSASSDGKLKIWSISKGQKIMALSGHTMGKEVITLSGHTTKVNVCSLSPDGKYLVTAGSDYRLSLWDINNGELIVTLFGHGLEVKNCFFSHDGTKIISADNEGIKFWDIDSRRELIDIQCYSSWLSPSSLSPDGRRIVTLGGGGDYTFFLWDTKSGKEIARIFAHSEEVESCHFSPDGKFILSASSDCTLALWDAKIAEEYSSEKDHRDIVTTCRFSPDGTKVVSASNDIKVWYTKELKESFRFTRQREIINDCAFSPDSKLIVSGGWDGVLRIWGAEKGEELWTLKVAKYHVNYCFFNSEGDRIICECDKERIIQLDVKEGREIATLQDHSIVDRDFPFSPDGKLMVFSKKDQSLRLWDLKRGTESVTVIDAARLLPYFAFSPDNTKVITYREKEIHFWDVQSWKEIDVRALHLEGEKTFSFSPDGSLFLSSGEQKKEKRETRTIYEVKVWDARRFEAIRTYLIEVYGEEMIKCRFSQDGKRIFWASDETIKFFDIETGEELTYKDRFGGMSAFALSPEERKIFVGNKEGHIFIFSLENVPEFPAVVTPLEKNGKLFFQCFYCTENNEIKKRSLGREIECRHCGHINRLNPFVWVSHKFNR